MDLAAHPQAVFVTAQIDLTGGRGGFLGGRGRSQTASGALPVPGPGLVLWRVIERVSVEKQLEAREISPAADGQSLAYSYTVKGGGGGPFPLDEPGRFEAEVVAVYAPPSFLTDVGAVEIVSTAAPPEGGGRPADVRRTHAPSRAQLEGRLIRLPSGDGEEDDRRVWFVERGAKRLLASPACGLLRFGDGWQRLVQPLPTAADLSIVPDGPPLSVAEAAEGRLVYSWPLPEAYWVQGGFKHLIDDDHAVKERFGDRWRIGLVHLRPADLAAIPDAAPGAP
jgi:hypothetical protein